MEGMTRVMKGLRVPARFGSTPPPLSCFGAGALEFGSAGSKAPTAMAEYKRDTMEIILLRSTRSVMLRIMWPERGIQYDQADDKDWSRMHVLLSYRAAWASNHDRSPSAENNSCRAGNWTAPIGQMDAPQCRPFA